jgi:hypothetical protein
MNTSQVLVDGENRIGTDPGFDYDKPSNECGKPAHIKHNGVWYCAEHYDKIYDGKGNYKQCGTFQAADNPLCTECGYPSSS